MLYWQIKNSPAAKTDNTPKDNIGGRMFAPEIVPLRISVP